MKSHITAALLSVVPALLNAQARPAVQPADYGKWESVGPAALSANGGWLAYTVNRVDEQVELRLHRRDKDTTTIVLSNGSNPVFAANSRWLTYTINVLPAKREALEREKKPVRSSVAVVDLAAGGKGMTIAESGSARFSGDARFLAVRLYPADAAKRDAADLLVRDLVAGTTQTFGNIAAYAWTDHGSLLAMTVQTDGGVGNGVQVLEASSGQLRTLASSGDLYRALAWRRAAADLAVLRSESTPGFRDSTHQVLAWRSVGAPTQRAFTLDPAAAAQVPSGLRISEARVPEWSRDGTTLALGLRPRSTALESTLAVGTDKRSDVQVWHARDLRPIPQQKAQENADARRTLYAVWRLDEQRLVQVGRDLDGQVTVDEAGNFALESSATRFTFGEMFGRPQDDVDVIDLKTGERRRLLDGHRFQLALSPDGRQVAHFKDGAWWLTATATGAAVNASAKAGTEFGNREDDHPADAVAPWGAAGWSADGKWFLVYDKYDVWRLASDGSRAERLTNGAADRMVHRVTRLEPPGRRGSIDLTKLIFVTLTGEWSKRTGFAQIRVGQGFDPLVVGDASHGRLMKADSAPTLAFTRERFDTSPNWWVGGAAMEHARQVSDVNPFQSQYAWGSAELVEFTSDSGRRLQGALYYPANYDPARKYPMIVNTYEIMSTALHVYVPPSERTYYNRTAWTQRGYFVFTPDVVFRPGDPGRSYLECVIPAVKSVIARGMVDSARVGLVGHSWGGYEAAYAPTQTNLFATSIAGAPITNFLSFSGAFHWTPGIPEFDHWEMGQARMAKPPWEDVAGHLRNSPAAFVDKLQRPMLMVFGDADGTVDWHQGVEFYNFARRAGKEDFVMLVYPGEDHGLRKKENQIDYHRRIVEWFAYWLKGEPAADWIKRGVTWQERKALIEPRQ